MKKTAMIMAATASCIWMPLTTTSVAAKQAAASDEAQPGDDKIRCRKIAVIGSLVKKTKVCKTVAEWRMISDKGNRNARDVVESGQACAGGPMCNGN
jgi:hypothetical protein